jgi:uncharacterized protein YlzI (FlbEa/FlbD family)
MIIELTQSHGGQHRAIWLNANDISFMEIVYKPDETFTIIYIRRSGSSFGVMQTPEEIMELINQCK